MDEVYLVWHTSELEDSSDEEKLIGVYRTRPDADAAIARAMQRPGFSQFPKGFRVYPYKVNEDHWTEGFIDVVRED